MKTNSALKGHILRYFWVSWVEGKNNKEVNYLAIYFSEGSDTINGSGGGRNSNPKYVQIYLRNVYIPLQIFQEKTLSSEVSYFRVPKELK